MKISTNRLAHIGLEQTVSEPAGTSRLEHSTPRFLREMKFGWWYHGTNNPINFRLKRGYQGIFEDVKAHTVEFWIAGFTGKESQLLHEYLYKTSNSELLFKQLTFQVLRDSIAVFSLEGTSYPQYLLGKVPTILDFDKQILENKDRITDFRILKVINNSRGKYYATKAILTYTCDSQVVTSFIQRRDTSSINRLASI